RCLSDWSSDVCSSDLRHGGQQERAGDGQETSADDSHDRQVSRWGGEGESSGRVSAPPLICNCSFDFATAVFTESAMRGQSGRVRSEERRVGKEGGGGC